MSYYPEPDSYIRDKVKVVLDLPSYATKGKLYFIALKAKVDKLDKVDDLDVGKLKTVLL